MKRIVLCVVGLVALFSAMGPSPASATFPGSNGRIAFVDPNGRLMTIRPDGTGLRQIAADASSPVWSPSGKRIAFSRWIDAKQAMAVYVIRTDKPGAAPRQLGDYSRGWVQKLSWRPTGHLLLYADDLMDGDPSIGALKTVSADSPRTQTLADYADLNMHPAWSPDGSQIAWTRVVGGDPQGGGTRQAEIWIMQANGTGKLQLTHNHVLDENPKFSPNGMRIVYTHFAGAGMGWVNAGIQVMRLDGSGKHTITDAAGASDMWPTWSPTGRWISFTRYLKNGHVQVMTIRRDGTRLHLVVRDATDATWSPDGRWLVVGRNGKLFITPASGGPLRYLADGYGADWQRR